MSADSKNVFSAITTEIRSRFHNTSIWMILAIVGSATLLLVLTVQRVDLNQVLESLRQADVRLILIGIILMFASYILRGIRWHILLRYKDKPTYIISVLGSSVGYLGNNFLPSRLGEFIRATLVVHHTYHSLSYVFITILIERISDLIFLVCLSLFLITRLESIPSWMGITIQTFAITGFISIVLFFLISRWGNLLFTLINLLPLSEKILNKLLDIVRDIISGLRLLYDIRRTTLFAVSLVIIWTIDILIVQIIGSAIGIQIDASQAVLLLAGLGLSSAIPSTPGYVGVYQFVAVTVLGIFNISAELALSFIIIFQFTIYLTVLILGVSGLYFFGREFRNQEAKGSNVR